MNIRVHSFHAEDKDFLELGLNMGLNARKLDIVAWEQQSRRPACADSLASAFVISFLDLNLGNAQVHYSS